MELRPAVLVFALAAGCAGAPDEPITWEEFRAQAVLDPESGVWVVDGDLPAEDEDALAAAYQRYRDGALDDGATGSASQPQIVNVVDGRDDRWPDATAMRLTYCVRRTGRGGFGEQYDEVVAAMTAATRAWSDAARVGFVHVVAEDEGKCNTRTPVVFDVRRVCTGDYLARAFFPSSSRRGREILIDCSALEPNLAPLTLTGVLRHELGHTLGLRHEHTRPEAGTCFEDDAWRVLGAYNPSSVMHYPQCNGDNQGDLVLTALDRGGIAALYP